MERRLDHDLSRFEMVYPGRGGEDAGGGYLLEDEDEYDQDAHVARLEEENLTLKERLFLMEQEVGDMRRRLEALEARFSLGGGGVGGGENEVEEAPTRNDAERIHIGSENSSEDDVERVRVGSEKGRAQTQGAMGSERFGGDDTEEQGAVRSEKSFGNDAGEQDGSGVLEKTDIHNAEKQQGAAGSEKTGGNDTDEQDVVGGVLGKTGVHNAEEQQAIVGTEKRGDHSIEMVDSALEEKMDEDNDEDEVRLAALSR